VKSFRPMASNKGASLDAHRAPAATSRTAGRGCGFRASENRGGDETLPRAACGRRSFESATLIGWLKCGLRFWGSQMPSPKTTASRAVSSAAQKRRRRGRLGRGEACALINQRLCLCCRAVVHDDFVSGFEQAGCQRLSPYCPGR
jgi:hypothetical protein